MGNRSLWYLLVDTDVYAVTHVYQMLSGKQSNCAVRSLYSCVRLTAHWICSFWGCNQVTRMSKSTQGVLDAVYNVWRSLTLGNHQRAIKATLAFIISLSVLEALKGLLINIRVKSEKDIWPPFAFIILNVA